MASLISCWFIIENVIIPDGLRKWFYLSYYIHPSILFFCQIFLWLKLLVDCLLTLIFFPLKVTYVSCLYIFGVFRNCVVRIYSIIRLKTRTQVQEGVESYFEAQQTFDFDRTPGLYITSSESHVRIRSPVKLLGFEEEEDVFEESSNIGVAKSANENSFSGTDSFTTDETLDEFLDRSDEREPMFRGGNEFRNEKEWLFWGSNSLPSRDYEYSSFELLPPRGSDSQDMDEHWSNFGQVEREEAVEEQEEENDDDHDDDDEDSDGFYKTYSERMRWFDVLNYDRTCGISAIENNEIGTPSPLRSSISWTKMTTKRLLRSLENDFELVYVAQTCLSWKALHSQYLRVKTIENSTSQNGIFCSYLAAEFQKFQVLLDRFMEDESDGKRVSNYVNGRFSLKSLLQVPEVSVKGLVKEDKKNKKRGGTDIKGVLKVIEDCIEAFWLFVKTDNKKYWWQMKTSLWAYPPVEDPRDLQLLAQLTKRLQKNKLWLKDLEGKKRCLVKRIVNPLEESQRKEMMFTMIDMKLISRVLQMSIISSAQLKWCQEKLDNVEFKDGKVFRSCNDPLFPP